MANARLKNVVRFTAALPGAPTALPHGLNIEGRAVVPDYVVPQTGGFTVTADSVNVTVTNNGGAPADIDVLVEHWHTTERAFGTSPGNDAGTLTPQPFVLGTGGTTSSAPVISFVYRPGGVAGGNVYTSWPALVAALALAPGLKQIFFDDSIVSPAPITGIPADMTDVAWIGRINGNSFVTVAEGAVFTKLRVLQDNLIVTFTGTTPPVDDFVAGETFVLIRGAVIGATGAGPFVRNSAVGAPQVIIAMQDGARIENQGTPVLDLAAGSATAIIGLALGDLQSGALSGAATAFTFLGIAGSSASISEVQPAYAGTYSFTSLAIARHNPTPTQVGAVGAQPNEIVRCDPTGGAFTVTLPSAIDRRGQSIVVKNVSASANIITIDAQAGETIDGAASTTIAAGFGSKTFESDGVSEWMVTATAGVL